MLALGVEKMWTGDRAGTIAGIEDGLPAEYRHDLHDRRHADDNPAGSILMGLNNGWAHRLMAEVGATVRQIAAAAVKAFEHAARNPLAQFQRRVTDRGGARLPAGGRRPHPAHVQLVHRRRGRRGAGRPVGRRPRPRRPVSSARWRAPETARSTTTTGWPRPPTRPGRPSASAPATPTWSSCTTPPSAEELYALESLGFFAPGEAGPATEAGATGIDSPGLVVNPSGGLVGRGHPLGRHGPGPGGRAGHAVPRPGRAPARSPGRASAWP